jgi:hypothetical protein
MVDDPLGRFRGVASELSFALKMVKTIRKLEAISEKPKDQLDIEFRLFLTSQPTDGNFAEVFEGLKNIDFFFLFFFFFFLVFKKIGFF